MHTILDERDKMKFDEELKSIEDNVIVVSKSGEVINIHDCTGDDPPGGLRVFGKTEQKSVAGNQLCNLPDFAETTRLGIKWSCSNGEVKAVGTSTELNSSRELGLLSRIPIIAGTYFISGSKNEVFIYARVKTADGTINYYSNRSFTLDGTETEFEIYAQISSGKTVNEIVYPMLNKGTTAIPWEPYVGGIPSPNPEYPQELVSAGKDGNVEVGVYGGNLFDANALTLHTNKTLDVSDDGYTIVCTGGTNDSYRFSYFYLDVNAMRGKTIYLTADSIVSNSIRGVQLIVYYDNAATEFYPIEKGGQIASRYISDHVTRISINIYSNNTSTALDTDNTITVKGLRLTLEENSSWTPCKQKQTLTIQTPNGLPAVPVTDASLATYTDENGQMYCADEVDFERGVYVQRLLYDRVKSSSDWKFSSLTNRFYAEDKRYKKAASDNNTDICFGDYKSTHFINSTHHGSIGEDLSMAYINGTINGFAYRYIALNSDINAWKTFLDENEVYTLGILATPIETQLYEEEIAQYKALHTNYSTTTFLNDANAHMEVKYIADVQNHIEQNYVSKAEYEAAMSQVSMIETAML